MAGPGVGAGIGAGSGAARAAVPVAPSAAFLDGRFAASQGDFGLAADSYLQALRGDPGDPELIRDALVAAAMTDRPDAVKLAQMLPDSPAARLVLANAAVLKGNWQDAVTQLSGMRVQGPMRRLRPLLLAWAQQGAGDPGAALQGLAQAAAADVPARGIYDLHAGMIADIDGRTADADRLYGAARAAFQGDNLRLAQVLASWQARQGHTEAADATLRAAIASDPDLAIAEPGLLHGIATRPVSRATEGMAEAYLATAAALRQQDQLDDALLLLRLAADLRPDFAAARLLAAEIDDDTDHPDAGLAALSHVALNDPLAPVVRLRRAWLMEETGDDAASQRELTQLIREQPDRPEPEKALADLLRREGHDRASLPHYDRAVVLARGRDGTWGRSDWSLFYARGLALEAVQEPAQAEADFEHALALDPDQPEILNYLGYAWAEQGRHLKRARQMIERAVALRPNDGNLIDSLGWVQLRQGDKAAAVRTLEQATELEPEDPVINAHLGDAYWEDGRKREAEFQWRRALNLHPAPEEAARLEAKLGASPVVAGAAQDRSVR